MALTTEQRRRGGLKRAQMADFAEHQRKAGQARAALGDMAAIGHKGAQAFIAKYGYGKLYRICRDWRLAHPSCHEQQVMDVLCTLGFEPARDYEREFEVEDFLSVDIGIPLLKMAIEVNGAVHYDPMFDDARRPGTRAANDADKVARLHRLGWSVLVLDYRDAARFDQFVGEFIRGG